MQRWPAAHPCAPASPVAPRHVTQRFACEKPGVAWQNGVVPEQSDDVRQRTQLDDCVSHTGAVVVHWLLVKQPARHWPFAPQIGVAPLHCAFEPHCTHVPFMQCGVAPEQSASVAHCSQALVDGSQTLRVLGQSEPEMQPTHALVDVSHIGAAPAQRAPAPPSGAQAARQV